MSEQRNSAQSADATEVSPGTVTLVIDYGNGAQKRFTGIPWEQGDMSILRVLNIAGSIPPGLRYELDLGGGVDRAGRTMATITSIDGLEANQPSQEWSLTINKEPSSIRVELVRGSGSEMPLVNSGDFIELRLVTSQ